MVESKKKENGRVVKWILFPSLLASFVGLFLFPPIRLALALYLAMGIWSLNAYRQKAYQEEVYGIKKKGLLTQIFLGIGLSIAFLILSAISPAFSLLTPALSLTISEDIRWAIIVLLAPLMEECWRSATKGYIQDIYRWKFWKLNIAQAFLFMILHGLVYGIGFNAYDRWIQVWGSFLAIFGSLLAAFIFGLLSGYLMEKTKSVIPSIFAHIGVNFYLVSKGMIVIISILVLITKIFLPLIT